jgi:hypothetical protein
VEDSIGENIGAAVEDARDDRIAMYEVLGNDHERIVVAGCEDLALQQLEEFFDQVDAHSKLVDIVEDDDVETPAGR